MLHDRKINVFLIEDNDDDVLILEELLSEYGEYYDICHFGSFSLFENNAKESDPDIILVDLSLPECQGYETIKKVNEMGVRAPYIILTGLDDIDMCKQALNEGAQDYLIKGELNREILERAIQYAIERHKNKLLLKEANDALKVAAVKDPLTQAFNRLGFEEILSREIERTTRHGMNLYSLMLDIDDFKLINDRVSHSVGDLVLKELVRTLLSTSRETDYVVRLGGDEFMILFSSEKDADAICYAERLHDEIKKINIRQKERSISVTVSAGLMQIKNSNMTVDMLIAAKSPLIKRSKSVGKNCISFHENISVTHKSVSSMRKYFHSKEKFLDMLRSGHNLYCVRQPITSLHQNDPIGYEYLSRFDVEGFRDPQTFFEYAASHNMLNVLDTHCLKLCFETVEEYAQGHERSSVNVYPSTLISAPLDNWLDMISDCKVSNRLCLEISEQQLIGPIQEVRKKLDILRQRNVLVALDDIGFGQSCLENILYLEPDIIKIDKSCVIGIHQDHEKLRRLKILLRMLKPVTFQVIVEGIETEKDLDVVKDLGVSYGQGFLFGKPSPVAHDHTLVGV